MTEKGSLSPQSSLDFVTVVYYPEVLLLKLQARSFRLFLEDQRIGNIYIVVNEDDPRPTVSFIEEQVLPEYGPYASRVKIVAGNKLQAISTPVNGWRKQQTLKLLVARTIESEAYLALDAKNHFIKKCNVLNFLTPEGLMRTFRARQRGSLMQYFVNSANYFDLDPATYLDAAMPATTPYALSTRLVREMMDAIEKKEGTSFEDFFHAPHRNVTEFFLYFTYLVKYHSPIEQFYKFGKRNAVTLFTRWPDTEEKLREALEKLSEPSIVVFGLHKNRVMTLDKHFGRIISNYWAKVGLFADKSDAAVYLQGLRKSVQLDGPAST